MIFDEMTGDPVPDGTAAAPGPGRHALDGPPARETLALLPDLTPFRPAATTRPDPEPAPAPSAPEPPLVACPTCGTGVAPDRVRGR